MTRDCLIGITESAVPIADSAIYFAVPEHFHFGGTTLTPKSSSGSTTLVDSVSFNYQNQVANAITATGEGVVAGFAEGPWGAGIAGFVSLAGALAPQVYAQLSTPKWLCDQTVTDQNVLSLIEKMPDSLSLPVVIQNTTPDESATPCWHRMPAPQSEGVAANAGWFYQIVISSVMPDGASGVPPILVSDSLTKDDIPKPYDSKANPFLKTSSYFSDPTLAELTFPASACLAVKLKIARFPDIKNDGSVDDSAIGFISLAVADPAIVQVVSWSSGTTVTLLPCGAYATAGTPSTAITDDVNALVKEAQAALSAQQQWKSGKKN